MMLLTLQPRVTPQEIGGEASKAICRTQHGTAAAATPSGRRQVVRRRAGKFLQVLRLASLDATRALFADLRIERATTGP